MLSSYSSRFLGVVFSLWPVITGRKKPHAFHPIITNWSSDWSHKIDHRWRFAITRLYNNKKVTVTDMGRNRIFSLFVCKQEKCLKNLVPASKRVTNISVMRILTFVSCSFHLRSLIIALWPKFKLWLCIIKFDGRPNCSLLVFLLSLLLTTYHAQITFNKLYLF